MLLIKRIISTGQRLPRVFSNTFGVSNASSLATSPTAIIGQKFPERRFTYSERDAILYALGVGASLNQADHLKFVYERHEKFSVLPTFAVVPGLDAFGDSILTGDFCGYKVDMANLLHGEQYLEVFKPLRPSDTLISSAVVADVIDKRTASIILCNVDTRDEMGAKVAFNQILLYVRGAGGFGGHQKSDKLINVLPVPAGEQPTSSMIQQTSIDQAALYRLSGDRNPLHIDPAFAARGGLTAPILHGLCTFGFSARHALSQFCANDVSKIKAIKVRFSGTVLPGQTLRTDMWKRSDRVHLQTSVVETGHLCLKDSYIVFRD